MLNKRHAGTARRLLPALLVASAELASTAALANDKFNVGALRFTSHSASFIAFEKGYFKEVGLDVEFKYFQAAAPMAVAIASGEIDYGITAITGGLINLADKGVIKVIGGALHEAVRLGHRVVVLSRRPGQVREILEIDLPLDARAAHGRELEGHRHRLWSLLRDEAQAADLELVGG